MEKDNKRIVLAIGLSIAVLVGWQLLFPPEPPPPGDENLAADAGTADAGTSVTDKPNGPKGPPAPAPKPAPVPLKVIKEAHVEVEAPRFKATLTNSGGRLLAFEVLDPPQYQKRGDLIRPLKFPEGDTSYQEFLPYSTTFGGKNAVLPEGAMYEIVAQSNKGATFKYTDPGDRFAITKTYTLSETNPYSFDLDITVENPSDTPFTEEISLVNYAFEAEGEGGWSPTNPLPDKAKAVCYVDGSAERGSRSDAEDGKLIEGVANWGGIGSRYFTTLEVVREGELGNCHFTLNGRYLRNAMKGNVNVSPGGSQTWKLSTFVGPKKIEDLEVFKADLESSIDYGFFAVLCHPIRYLLVMFHGFTGNWGWAIVLLTIMLRSLLFPVNQKAYKNMDGMRRIQVPMKEIKAKYENDAMVMQQKMMELYKKEGVSPFGCLPQFFQIPIFFALYRTIYSSVELYQADFFGPYTDLSSPDPYYILPVMVGMAMFGQQLLMPTNTSGNPQMKYMMYAMPVVFSGFTFVLPSGLALYMFVSVIIGVGQQYIIRRKSNQKDAAQKAEAGESDDIEDAVYTKKKSKKRSKKEAKRGKGGEAKSNNGDGDAKSDADAVQAKAVPESLLQRLLKSIKPG